MYQEKLNEGEDLNEDQRVSFVQNLQMFSLRCVIFVHLKFGSQ